jgi:hypothetical protein
LWAWRAITGVQKSRIYIYSIVGWTRPVGPGPKPPKKPPVKPPTPKGPYTRVTGTPRYCADYSIQRFNYRNYIDCGRWVQKVDPEARYFFFREQSNWHCSPCPTRYRGGTGYTSVDNNTNINIFSIRDPNPARWTRRWHRQIQNRYCGGYKKTNYKHRSIDACGRWVRQVDPEAKYFMYRLSGNFHCSPCPMYYNGSTTGTHADNSIMHIYRISGWSRPTYGW